MKAVETDRLFIRQFTMDDLKDLHQILDIELRWAGRLLTIDERAERLQSIIATYSDQNPFGRGAVIHKQTGRLMGYFGMNPELDFFDPPHEDTQKRYRTVEIELGYAFSSAYWGQGYGTEAGTGLLDIAFHEYRIRRIFAATEAENIRSQNLMRKLGLKLEPNPRPGWPDRILGVIENKE